MARMEAETTQSTAPAWAGDYLDREHVVPGGAKLDAAAFAAEDAVTVTVGANAAADAVSVTVQALAGAIPAGTLLDFGGKKFARTTSAAAKNATSISVSALGAALAAGDVASYRGTKKKYVAAGTLIGRTFAERENGENFGPAADADDEVYLICHDVSDVDREADVDLYRHKSIVKENYLPVFSTLSSTLKGKIRSLYITVRGVN